MTLSIASFTRTPASVLTAQELLQQSPGVLLGVGADAATELAKLGITTVFDLASSSVFATACKMAGASDPSSNGFAPGGIAGDLIDANARTIDLKDLPTQSIEILRAIGPMLAQSLSTALGVTNIREFALWPPYQAARLILSGALGLDAAGADPEAPADLVPGSRPYPTERVQYEVLMLDELDTSEPSRDMREMRVAARPWAAAAAGKPLEEAGQLDLAAIAAETTGFARPAFGALLTYTQSWFPEGLALGQLLHSIALAPGESTRLAMVDWSRRTSGSTSESVSEGEALTANLERGRSIGEIVNAVATEAQQGFSESFGVGAGTSVGTASGGAGSADLSSVAGLPLKVAGGSGESTGLGVGVGYARSSSWTTGQRNLSANMAQNIVDRTHQASTLARNRRATIVREVSQTESERVSTRTVTNYNHMHALSIEYFEVVQLYRVIVELTRVSAALFIPMKLIDFNKPGVVARYKRVLATSGLTPQVRALSFAEADTLLLSSPMKHGGWLPGDVQMAQAMFGEPVGEPGANVLALPLNFFPQFLSYFEDAPFESFSFEFSNGAVASMPVVDTVNQQIGKYNVVLVDVYGQAIEKASPFWDVVSIRAKKKAASATWSGTVNIFFRMASLQREGFPKPQQGLTSSFIRVTIDVPATASEVTVFEMMRTVSGRALRQHLMDNQLYYSQRVWSTLDSTTVAQLLSGYTFRGRQVLSEVDPLPVTVAGNFLVFRKHEPVDTASRTVWEQWLTARDITRGERKVDLVPLPSGGVFAEAVLGRFNSAEKLDITRFWNWIDSPIPITAPEIAAIQMGSRAQAEGLMPSQLSPATLKVELPPDAPDPQGLTAILQAIQNGNMFRDMSGMTATIGFAQGALTRAFDAARDAAAQAGENMKTAADIYKSAFGGQGSTMPGGTTSRPASGTTRNASETGALINHGRTMDNRGSNNGSNGGAPSGTRPGTMASGSQALTGQESAAFNSALGEGGQSGWGYTPVSGTDPLRIDDYRYLSVVSQFRDLVTFPAPTALATAAEARGLTVQSIRDGWGPVNLDRYLIRINKLPKDPQSGAAFTEEGFFEYVRKNFPKFLQPFPRTGNPESLAPFSTADATSWGSNTPLGSVLEFTIDVPMAPDAVAPMLPERGLVLCTEYSSESGRDHHWNFSTVTGPRPAGYHPVSGTRQFGLRTGEGYWFFYTRAADRMGWLLEWSQSEKVYEGQDVYWKYFQTALRKFVTDNEGEAEIADGFAERFEWDQVQRIVWRPSNTPV